MNRRFFFRRTVGAVVAFTLARHLPGIAPAPPEPLKDEAIGISMRFIKEWDIETPCRFDVIYGWPVNPEMAVRVQG